MNILHRLLAYYQSNRLANVYLIATDDDHSALKQVNQFIGTLLDIDILQQQSQQKIVEHVDYLLVERQDKAAEITIAQIRQMQLFISKTSIISGYKFIVINQADLMNLSAANCCLKTLEAADKNTYIFLLTTQPQTLLPTMLSRCAKVDYYFQRQLQSIDQRYLPILTEHKIADQLTLLQNVAAKDGQAWHEFSQTILQLINKFAIYWYLQQNDLTSDEQQLWHNLQIKSYQQLAQMHETASQLIYHTNRYELDKQASALLLINQFRANNL